MAAAKARLGAWQSLSVRLRAAAAAKLPDLETLLALHASLTNSHSASQVTCLNLSSAALRMHALCLCANIAYMRCPAGGIPAAGILAMQGMSQHRWVVEVVVHVLSLLEGDPVPWAVCWLKCISSSDSPSMLCRLLRRSLKTLWGCQGGSSSCCTC